MNDLAKIRPYEHLTDAELHDLTGQAADLRLRLASQSPGEIRETLIAYGCPAVAAIRMVMNPLLLPNAARFHIDTQDTLLGDPDARARVEHVQEGWERLRAREAPESAEQALAEAKAR